LGRKAIRMSDLPRVVSAELMFFQKGLGGPTDTK
jgi:hypothetical protein